MKTEIEIRKKIKLVEGWRDALRQSLEKLTWKDDFDTRHDLARQIDEHTVHIEALTWVLESKKD